MKWKSVASENRGLWIEFKYIVVHRTARKGDNQNLPGRRRQDGSSVKTPRLPSLAVKGPASWAALTLTKKKRKEGPSAYF